MFSKPQATLGSLLVYHLSQILSATSYWMCIVMNMCFHFKIGL